MPRIERLEQNTAAWLRWRMAGIGSSDAPVIMGEAAFKTRRLLWAIKTGRARDFAGNAASRRGHALEQAARSAYERQFGVQMEPLCLVHDQLEWMRASLDGLSFDGATVLEIKCPLSLRDHHAAQQGRVPAHYYGQLQHQLEVSGAGEAHYWSFDGRCGRLVRMRPDRDYLRKLVDEEGEFWRRVQENRWPELDDKELDMSSDPGWRSLALRYRQARARLDAATEEEGKLRIILDRMATARRTFGCGVEVVKSFRRGTVDYALIPELAGVNLEKFRKPQVAVTRINVSEASAEESRL
ncbi:MAG TPA: YqaJ viral recombinase family protein [Candidatus Binataceae bacterium]|nr:YqaJ viral recombinase family protein [Candidatus Binataceae bacterium]